MLFLFKIWLPREMPTALQALRTAPSRGLSRTRNATAILKGVSPYIRAKFRILLNKGSISREHSETIQFATA